MTRRNFITVLAGAAAYPLSAGAQQKVRPVIGFLGSISPGPNEPTLAAFYQGLSETGYAEGQNMALEYRRADGRYDRLAALAADLVPRKVDVIRAPGGNASVLTAKSATSTIQIVPPRRRSSPRWAVISRQPSRSSPPCRPRSSHAPTR